MCNELKLKACRTCGEVQPLSQYEQFRRHQAVSYRGECRKCRSIYNAAAQALCRARKRGLIPPPQPSGYVPVRDFLPMLFAGERRPLVAML